MGEKPNIAAILAAAKEKKSALEAEEAAKKEAEEAERESQALEAQAQSQAKIDDYKSKQKRLAEIQTQRSADAKALLEIRAKLKGDRQEIRDLELPEEDESGFLAAIKEASTDEAAGGESTRGEISSRNKNSRSEMVDLKKNLDVLGNDSDLQDALSNESEQKLAKLKDELSKVEIRLDELDPSKDEMKLASSLVSAADVVQRHFLDALERGHNTTGSEKRKKLDQELSTLKASGKLTEIVEGVERLLSELDEYRVLNENKSDNQRLFKLSASFRNGDTLGFLYDKKEEYRQEYAALRKKSDQLKQELAEAQKVTRK